MNLFLAVIYENFNYADKEDDGEGADDEDAEAKYASAVAALEHRRARSASAA